MSAYKRPLLAIGVFGFCALIAGELLPFWTAVCLAVFCTVAGILALLIRPFRKASVCLLAATAALLWFLITESVLLSPLIEFDGRTVALTGTVKETGRVAHGVLSVEVQVTNGDLPAGATVLLHTPFADLPPVYGDEITAEAVVQLRDAAQERTLFNPAKADGVFLTGWTEDSADFRLARRDVRSFKKAFSLMKASVSEALLSGLPRDVRPLLSAMCLGDKSELSDEVIADFRRAGVSHLLVVSGLHMSIVAMGLYGILRRLRFGRRVSSAAALCALWAFALLVGFHPSVVRACVLNTLALFGNLFRRRADGLNSLGGGLLLLWVCDPYCVCDVGLWLSFGATFGLLCLLPWMTNGCDAFFKKHSFGRWEKPARVVTDSFCVTLSATLPILPICAFVFGEISLIAPLTNLLCVFAATLLLWSAAAALCFNTLYLGLLADGFRLCATLLARYLLAVTAWLGNLPGVTWSTEEGYRRVWIVVTLLAVGLLWWRFGKRKAIAGLAVACLLLAGLCVGDRMLSADKTDISLERAYGDNAILLTRNEIVCLLVDGGNGWTAAKTMIDHTFADRVETVVVLDADRRLTRKWLELNDSVSVDRYVLTDYGENAITSLQETGEKVLVREEIDLFDGAVSVRREEDVVHIRTTSGETASLCLCDTGDVSLRLA